MNGWELGSQLQGEGGHTHHSGREPVWPVLSTTDIPGTPPSNVSRLTIISERIHLRQNQARKGRKGLKFRSITHGIGRDVFTETLNFQLLTLLSSQQLLSSLNDGPTHMTVVSSTSLKRFRKPKRHLVFTEEFIPSIAHLRPIDSPSWIRDAALWKLQNKEKLNLLFPLFSSYFKSSPTSGD